MKKIITIDGPAASGKSSLSRELARKMGWNWVSTGAFYRLLGYLSDKKGVSEKDEAGLVALLGSVNWEIRAGSIQTEVFIDGVLVPSDEVYSVENGTRASNVSVFQSVRDAVLVKQRETYEEPGLIAEGRDCGSVIFPESQLKIYLVASSTTRSQRRANETSQDEEAVQEALKVRDHQDSKRESAPMEAPKDAWILDSSSLSLEEVIKKVHEKALEVFKN